MVGSNGRDGVGPGNDLAVRRANHMRRTERTATPRGPCWNTSCRQRTPPDDLGTDVTPLRTRQPSALRRVTDPSVFSSGAVRPPIEGFPRESSLGRQDVTRPCISKVIGPEPRLGRSNDARKIDGPTALADEAYGAVGCGYRLEGRAVGDQSPRRLRAVRPACGSANYPRITARESRKMRIILR